MRFLNKRHRTSLRELLPGDLFYKLYYPTQWPHKFYPVDIGWSHISASTAIKRIDHFIKTDGAE